jgi:GT2 family glycosyltransferase
MAALSVVVPTVGRPDRVSLLLASIARCDPHPDEVLVVDGEGSDQLETVVAKWDAELNLKLLVSPRGVSRQRNAGIASARGDVIVFLDDDVVIEGRTFAQIHEAFDDQGVVGVTGRVIEPRGRRLVAQDSRLRRWIPGGGTQGGFTRYGYPRYVYDVDVPRDVQFMPGCFACVRTPAARAIGFDENLAVAEDEDFSYRLSHIGRIRYLPEISIIHRKLGFKSREPRTFDQALVWTRRYLFRKNFEQTALARMQFGIFLITLVAHRIVNGDLAGARGLLHGHGGSPRGLDSVAKRDAQ